MMKSGSVLFIGSCFGLSMFGAGFLLGTVRVLLVAPAMGEFQATLVELPFIMTICWYQSLYFVKKLDADSLLDRIGMGFIAFGTLMVLEVAGSLFIFHKTLDEFLKDSSSAKGTLGTVCQFISSLSPVWQLLMGTHKRIDKAA
jgi:hypothetical protein